MTNARNPVASAAAWSIAAAIPFIAGAAACLRFPIFVDPFTTVHRPTALVIAVTFAAWLTGTACEITFAARNPEHYPEGGPVAWLLVPYWAQLRSLLKYFPAYATQLLFYASLFAFFPAVGVVTTTDAPAWIWIASLPCISAMHILLAIHQHKEWRNET